MKGRSSPTARRSAPSLRDSRLLVLLSLSILFFSLLTNGLAAPAAAWSSPSKRPADLLQERWAKETIVRGSRTVRIDLLLEEARRGLLRPSAPERWKSNQLWALVDRASGLGRALRLGRTLHLGSIDRFGFEARMTGPLMRPGTELRFRFAI